MLFSPTLPEFFCPKSKNPLPRFGYGQRVPKIFCDLRLLSHRFEISHHNRRHAARMPMMMDMMMIAAVRVLCSHNPSLAFSREWFYTRPASLCQWLGSKSNVWISRSLEYQLQWVLSPL